MTKGAATRDLVPSRPPWINEAQRSRQQSLGLQQFKSIRRPRTRVQLVCVGSEDEAKGRQHRILREEGAAPLDTDAFDAE